MSKDDAPILAEGSDPRQRLSLGLSPRLLVGVTLFYAACLAFATYPAMFRLDSEIPGHWIDALAHLWTMRWYKTCLAEGALPFHSPGIQYPVGAALGNLPPMHLESLLYLPLSWITDNDVLCFNLIWLFGFLTTGLGTFFLCWYVLRDVSSALLGGLLGMLSTPMLLHGLGHLEMIQMGAFPVFLVAWWRWLDRPTFGKLLGAWGLYLLVTMSAPYYMILSAFPAALALISGAWRAGRREWRSWLRARLPGLLAFSALTLPSLVVLFSGQVWAIAQGLPMERPDWMFNLYGASWSGYLVPTTFHPLGRLLAEHSILSGDFDPTVFERASYLGIVPIALILYAALRRVRFPRAGYWWAALAMLIVLSLGAQMTIGGRTISLPAGWLRDVFPPMRFLRVPARFNLFSAVIAALIAAAGVKHLLSKLPNAWAKQGLLAALIALVLADQSLFPMMTSAIPTLPTIYQDILDREPDATFLEVPQYHPFSSFESCALNSVCGYWQSTHGGRTTAGYTANNNLPYDDLLGRASPFNDGLLRWPEYLVDADRISLDLASDVAFADYSWLYLKTHGLDYVVVHHWMLGSAYQPQVARLCELLAEGEIYRDDRVSVFDRRLLKAPGRPIALVTEGWKWRQDRQGRPSLALRGPGQLAFYNPDPDLELTIALEAEAFGRPVALQVLAVHDDDANADADADDRVLARWEVPLGPIGTYVSPPLRLPAGYQELKVEHVDPRSEDWSILRVSALNLRTAADVADASAADSASAVIATQRESRP